MYLRQQLTLAIDNLIQTVIRSLQLYVCLVRYWAFWFTSSSPECKSSPAWSSTIRTNDTSLLLWWLFNIWCFLGDKASPSVSSGVGDSVPFRLFRSLVTALAVLLLFMTSFKSLSSLWLVWMSSNSFMSESSIVWSG